MLETPILFLIFNRPDTTKQVFDKIRQVQPRQLFIAADGPRVDREGETDRCAEVRRIASAVDWPCQVSTLFHDTNRGCALAVSGAITWFFKHVEAGIILEDDCLPAASFFPFCEKLLKHYKSDDRVMHIGGNNYFNRPDTYTYYFSNYIHPPHGWATWRRAWAQYDYEMTYLKEFIDKGEIQNILNNTAWHEFWIKGFLRTQQLQDNSWDNQWQLAVWKAKGYAVMPYLNLVKNLGYGPEATHTKNPKLRSNIQKIYEINTMNMNHPKTIDSHEEADNKKMRYIYLNEPNLVSCTLSYAFETLKKLIKGIVNILK